MEPVRQYHPSQLELPLGFSGTLTRDSIDAMVWVVWVIQPASHRQPQVSRQVDRVRGRWMEPRLEVYASVRVLVVRESHATNTFPLMPKSETRPQITHMRISSSGCLLFNQLFRLNSINRRR